MLTNLGSDAELFHTANGTAFADLMIDGHRETWAIRGSRFRSWLRRQYYESTGTAPSAGAIGSALDLLEARAQFEAPLRAVYIRVAEHGDRIYLDLADDRWRAVEVGPEGWQVITTPPVRFRRAAGMRPLPIPAGGGSIDALAPFLNLPDRSDFEGVDQRIGVVSLAQLRTGPKFSEFGDSWTHDYMPKQYAE